VKKIFILPYIDQEMKFWEKLSGLYGDRIREVYFPIMDGKIGSGRPIQPNEHLPGFLKSKILPVSVLVNPVVLLHPVNEIADRICRKLNYYQRNFHLIGVTVANLELAQTIKRKFPDLMLTASTLMDIVNEQQLVMLGEIFNTIVPSNRILRDFRSFRALRNCFQGKIRIIVNEACLPSCVYRTQHFYEMSNPEIAIPKSLCNNLLEQKPWLRLTGGWVLPQHLFLFDGLYDEIKLAGRVSLQNPDRYLAVFDSYLKKKPLQPHEIGGGPASVNIPMDITTDFYKYTLFCLKNCTTCSVCEDYWMAKISKKE